MTDAGLRLRPDGTDRGREWEALRKRLRIALPCLALCCLALLVLLPQARRGAMALLNRLYAASEARNRYRYPRFALPEDISVSLALGLIGLALLAWGLWLPCLRARWPVCLTALLLAGAQAYYGLTLPPLLNLTLFAGLGLLLLRSRTRGKALCYMAAFLCCALLTLLLWPQVDEATERASEALRDRLSPPAAEWSGGTAWEEPQAVLETRHINRQSLTEGEESAGPENTYRLVTVEQQELARPDWLNLLRVALLLLLVAALVVLPFLPFLWLNRQRRKAQEYRAAFHSGERNLAAQAMFRHSVRYLEATGKGAGNRLYRDWWPALAEQMGEAYAGRFHGASLCYEKALYSEHALTEAELDEVRGLLAETERLLYEAVPARERLRLRWRECLHE